MNYSEFIENKEFKPLSSGFDANDSLINNKMKPHQKVCTKWALKRGRSALFLDTGLGKSFCLLQWAECVASYTRGLVLILAPLAVTYQIEKEANKFNIKTSLADSQECIKEDHGIFITNYEKIDNFDCSLFSGVVLDESSILKGFYGSVRENITNSFKETPFKLSTTATPSPNDFMELGTQSEFLGIMSQMEMLSMFFINDTQNTGTWRLKKHAEHKFWEWMSTWSIVLRKPSDLGFDDEGYDLPNIHYKEHIVETKASGDDMFVQIAQTLTERSQARRDTARERCQLAASIANKINDKCIIWCDRNNESELLKKSIEGAVEVKGSDKPDHKKWALTEFAEDGTFDKLVSKPKIAGYGLNYQKCNRMIFVGLSDSFESMYQSIRRCFRFGQEREVFVDIIISDREGAVLDNIKRKQNQHEEMSNRMIKHMRELTKKQIDPASQNKIEYNPTIEMTIPSWLVSET